MTRSSEAPEVSSAMISSATARARGGIAKRNDASPVYSTPSTLAPRESWTRLWPRLVHLDA